MDELLRTAEACDDAIHEKILSLCMRMGALKYHVGPIKSKERIEEKMVNDYKGDCLQVVDIVRSSAVFHSLVELNSAVEALMKSDSGVCVVRVKDRINNFLDSGYRDVLLNLTITGYDFVMELQLHLKDIIALKVSREPQDSQTNFCHFNPSTHSYIIHPRPPGSMRATGSTTF